MTVKITFDARWIRGGIGTYICNLLAGICQAGKGWDVLAITRREYLPLVQQLCPRVRVIDVPIYTLSEQFQIARAARGSELLHVPHYNAPLLYHGPLLVSIHDLIHLMDPFYEGSLKSWVYARPMLKMIAFKAAHIVTVSEYSRKAIIDRLGVSPAKVTVIYNGVNSQFGPMDRREAMRSLQQNLDLHSPYFLYVGSLKLYKNVVTLLKAFAAIRARHGIEQLLVIVGDDAHGKAILAAESRRLGLDPFVRFLPYAPQQLLRQLYSAADCFVLPSKLEGFGLPVLEAMACGAPVISSNAASLPEVGGDAVLYFDPSNYEELAEKMMEVLCSTELQGRLRTTGLARAKLFTWEKSTEKHLELYNRLTE